MDETLSTEFRIAAQIRIADQNGISMVVIHKGATANGSLFLKINTLDGYARILSEVHVDGKQGWFQTTETALTESEADKYLAEQLAFDPDLWVIEIEDRQGRHWFPEPIFKNPA